MKRISNEFFKNAILKGDQDILDEFEPSVSERMIGGDTFFEIEKNSAHHSINEKITKIILSKFHINSSACGFVPGKSYFDFLIPHVGSYYFLRLDIKNFFHSIPCSEIKLMFAQYLSNDKNENQFSPLDISIKATTHKVSKNFRNEALRDKEILPIGFPSSPIISNIIFRRIDILIQKYCEDKKIIYSRYADDLLFSSYESKFIHSEQFEKEISIYLSTLSLKLNKKKRIASENTISLHGYVIQNVKQEKPDFFMSLKERKPGKIRLSNKKTKIIKKMCAHLKKGTSAQDIMEGLFGLNRKKTMDKYDNNSAFYQKYCTNQLQNKLKGYRSYLISIINAHRNHQCIDERFISTAKELVRALENSIS
jgi:Reverse transcriptase (RNA-dependent DNA polymerase).